MSDDKVTVVLGTLVIEPNSMLVRLDPTANKVGNIILPDTTQEQRQYAVSQGEVALVGAFLWHYDQEIPRPDVGDRVMFTKYAGTAVTGDDGRDYQLIHEKDVRMSWKKKEGQTS